MHKSPVRMPARKQGDSRGKAMMLLWAQEGKYWKIVAIRIDDGSSAGLTPKKTPAAPSVSEFQPAAIAGDSNAVKSITDFYQLWVVKRDTAAAVQYASALSFQCMATPSAANKKLKPTDRLQMGLEKPLGKVPQSMFMQSHPTAEEFNRCSGTSQYTAACQ